MWWQIKGIWWQIWGIRWHAGTRRLFEGIHSAYTFGIKSCHFGDHTRPLQSSYLTIYSYIVCLRQCGPLKFTIHDLSNHHILIHVLVISLSLWPLKTPAYFYPIQLTIAQRNIPEEIFKKSLLLECGRLGLLINISIWVFPTARHTWFVASIDNGASVIFFDWGEFSQRMWKEYAVWCCIQFWNNSAAVIYAFLLWGNFCCKFPQFWV